MRTHRLDYKSQIRLTQGFSLQNSAQALVHETLLGFVVGTTTHRWVSSGKSSRSLSHYYSLRKETMTHRPFNKSQETPIVGNTGYLKDLSFHHMNQKHHETKSNRIEANLFHLQVKHTLPNTHNKISLLLCPLNHSLNS